MQTLRRTPLYDRHVALGARMVPFAGWEMPVQYEGVIAEHRAVRNDCGVFDVSHMGELEVEGPRARELLQALLSNDLDRIGAGEAQYTLLTNERGGIVDDLIVYRLDPFRFLLDRQRLEPRGRLRVAEGARDAAARTCATSPTSTRCSRCRGRARSSGSGCRGARLHVRRGRDRRRRRAWSTAPATPASTGVELMCDGRRRARALGRRRSSAAPCRAGSARATRCGSRSATRCTATTSGPTPTRSRPGSAGCARSTRSSPASRSSGGSRRRGRSAARRRS